MKISYALYDIGFPIKDLLDCPIAPALYRTMDKGFILHGNSNELDYNGLIKTKCDGIYFDGRNFWRIEK